MRGLEEAPMSAMEEQLRDAFGAAADTITAQNLPGLPAPAGRARVTRRLWAWAPRLRTQAFVPLAAAAGVAVIAVAATVVAPRLLPGPAAGAGGALAGAPKFFAGISEHSPAQPSQTTVVNIFRSATGQVAASFRPPKPYRDFVAVARLGGDNTYVAAAVTTFHTACDTYLFRFSIDAKGQPSGLTPLSAPPVVGQIMELVGSREGNMLAFTVTGRCAPARAAGVVNLASNRITTWPVQDSNTSAATFGSLSLTADGSTLGFLEAPGNGPSEPTNAFTLPTDTPHELLMTHAKKVLHVPTGLFRVVLSDNGSKAYVETRAAKRQGPVVLDQYSTATGQRVRRLSSHLGPGSPAALFTELQITVDAAGKNLLAYDYRDLKPKPNGHDLFHRVTAVNLTTGQQAAITAAQVPDLGDPFNTVAW
jgi:hypothetical protein